MKNVYNIHLIEHNNIAYNQNDHNDDFFKPLEEVVSISRSVF